MHPDQAQNTSSGIQGQEATAVAVIYVTAPTLYALYMLMPHEADCHDHIMLVLH